MVVKIKNILLTFDVEEFDLPAEFDQYISEDEQFGISRNGTEKILDILTENKIKATFFISAKFAENNKELIKKISKNHEIGLHCLDHKDNYLEMDEGEIYKRLKSGKEIIETITKTSIIGFRAPRFQFNAYLVLNQVKIEYDSSLNPTYVPGRYNHFFSPRKIFVKEGIKIIPISVSPILRLPIFWLAFRNLPLAYSKYITKNNKDYVCLIFHPWEFVDIKKFNVPILIKRNSGKKMINKFEKYLKFCSNKRYNFSTIKDYLFKN